jgi:molybdenum cofactor synthesis domain-containing protein
MMGFTATGKNLSVVNPSKPVRVAILTVSDRSASGEREDLAGPRLSEIIDKQGWALVDSRIVPDDLAVITGELDSWVGSGSVDLILTTGGTGFSARDITPEATLRVLDRPTPGLTEAMRAASLKKTPHAMLSRAAAGISGSTLIVNLPGSPTGAVENLQTILPALPHAIKILRGDPRAEEGHVPRRKPRAV